MTSPPDAPMRATMNPSESMSPDNAATEHPLIENPTGCNARILDHYNIFMSAESRGVKGEKLSDCESLAADTVDDDVPEKRANLHRIRRMLSSLCTALNHPGLVDGYFKSDPSERIAKRSAAVASPRSELNQVGRADSESSKIPFIEAKARTTLTQSGRRVKRMADDMVSMNKGRAATAFLARNKKTNYRGVQPTSEQRPNMKDSKSRRVETAENDEITRTDQALGVLPLSDAPKYIAKRDLHSHSQGPIQPLLRAAGDLAPCAGLKPSAPDPHPTVTVVDTATNRIISPRHCFAVVNAANENIHQVNGETSSAAARSLDSREWTRSENSIITEHMSEDELAEGRRNGDDPDPLTRRLAGPSKRKNTNAMITDQTSIRHPSSSLSIASAFINNKNSPSRVTPEPEPLERDTSSLSKFPCSMTSPPQLTNVEADQPLTSLETKESVISPLPLRAIAESSRCGNDALSYDEEMRAFLEDILSSGGKEIPLSPLNDDDVETEQLFDPVGSTFLPVSVQSQDEKPSSS